LVSTGVRDLFGVAIVPLEQVVESLRTHMPIGEQHIGLMEMAERDFPIDGSVESIGVHDIRRVDITDAGR